MSNIRPYVIINGVDSRTIQGLLITSLPPISKPAQRTLTETIDGRDGDSSIKLGYSAYDKSLGIALTYGYNVDDIIAFFNSEGTIIFSNEPDKVYNFEIFEQIDLEKLIRFKTGTVTIHTQPFKFSTSEEPKEFTNKEFTIVNSGNTDARPNIVITGEGLATMQINGKNALNIDFGDAEQTLLIDSEGMNAYHTENIKKVEAEITPKQDLHGFDSPFIDSDKVNKAPYLSRALAGTAERIGNYEYNKLVGGTVAFNQLVQNGNFSDTSAWLINNANANVSNNTISITATAQWGGINQTETYIVGHKYLFTAEINTNGNSNCQLWFGASDKFITISSNENAFIRYNLLFNAGSTGTAISITDIRTENFTEYNVKNVNLLDLTQMLGASIADYIYSLEQAQAGAGVAYFRALFSADYYPYNAGELMSVKASAHVTKNAGGAVIQTVALDPNLELRGIAKLDANNKLYYDGDTYSADGSVSRRFIKYTITGNEYIRTWVDNTSSYFAGHYGGEIEIPNFPVKTGGNNNGRASKIYRINFANTDKTIYSSAQDRLAIINDDYHSQAEWLSAIIGLEIIMEVETATTESAQAFNNPIAIEANGSEEFTDSRAVAIPVGHESYYANICDIEGFTEVNLTRTGKNLLDYTATSNTINGITYTVNADKTITANGTATAESTFVIFGTVGKLKKAVSYILTGSVSGYGNNIRLRFGVTSPAVVYDDFGDGVTIPAISDIDKRYQYLQITIKSGVSVSNLIFKPMIRFATIANSNYEAYAGEIFNKQFEQEGEPVTVYGGRYNFTTGLLEITKKSIDLGSLSYVKNQLANNKYGFQSYEEITDFKPATASNVKINAICELYPVLTGDQVYLGNVGLSGWSTQKRIEIYDAGNSYLTETQFRNFISGRHLVYELAEHIFIELDPETISALLGINNFYADTGEVTITFVNDGRDETQTGIIVTFDLDESDFNKGDLANRLVSGNYDNIRLKAGANSIKFTGSVSAVGFNKYSRWL